MLQPHRYAPHSFLLAVVTLWNSKETHLTDPLFRETSLLTQKGARTTPVIQWENREGASFAIESYVMELPLNIDPLPMVMIAIHSGRKFNAAVLDHASGWEGEATAIPYRTSLTPIGVDVHWRGSRGTFWIQLVYTSGVAQDALRKIIGNNRAPIQIDDQVLSILSRQLLEVAKLPPAPNREKYAESIITTFTAHLEWLAQGHQTSDMVRTSDPAVNETLLYIHAHTGDTLTIAQLASLQKMSPAYLRRRFHMVVGMPLHRYIIKYRVEQAYGLIERSQLPLAKIADQCGFSSLGHMSTAFTRILGVTPGVYRKQGAAKTGRGARELSNP